MDAFPLEYQAIMQHHVVLRGTPPFDGVTIADEDLRRACEAQARGHLIHLRQGWIDARGHAHDLEKLLVSSAMPLRVLLSHVAELDGHGGDDLAAYAGTRFGTDADIILAILALEHHPHGAHGLVAKTGAYLAASEHIWAFVDRWHK
mgnify:FL=1